MNTAEMWLKAQEDGKTYIAGDKIYNKKNGFKYLSNKMEPIHFGYIGDFSIFDIFMSVENWVEDPNTMTREQAEAKYGIKIID